MRNVFLILCTIFIATSSLFSQDVDFRAKTNLKKLGVNERLRVEFSMNQDGDNFTPPSFQGFTVVGGPSQSTSRQWVNGKSSFSKSFTYILSPNVEGTIKIGPAQITIDGEIFKTQPLDIQVTQAVDKPTDPNDVSFIAKENIHLVAEVSKSSPYINEAFTVVYKLYVADRTSVSTWRETESPQYADFWSQNMDEKQFKIYNGEYKGEPYRYVILRRTVLYPQKTGKLEIEPLALSVAVSVPTNRRDIFGRNLTKSTNIAVKAQKRTINVRPLPTTGKPDDFSGAVGNFNFSVQIDKSSLDAGEALELDVAVNGRGNLKLFELPKPVLPNALEVYEPQNRDQIRTNLSGMSGIKSQTYTIVPQYKGSYPIPPISFSYFDPATGTYKRQSADNLVINVVNGPNENDSNLANTGTANAQNIVAANAQFQFIKTKTQLKPVTNDGFFKSTLFWSLLILPLLGIPLALLVRKKRQAYINDVSGSRIRKADKLARKFLATAKKNLGNQKEFYVAMERALHNYLKAKLNITTSEMSKDRIARLLNERMVDETTRIEFIGLLESCEFARYTPSSNTAMQQHYDKAVRVLAQLDKQL